MAGGVRGLCPQRPGGRLGVHGRAPGTLRTALRARLNGFRPLGDPRPASYSHMAPMYPKTQAHGATAVNKWGVYKSKGHEGAALLGSRPALAHARAAAWARPPYSSSPACAPPPPLSPASQLMNLCFIKSLETSYAWPVPVIYGPSSGLLQVRSFVWSRNVPCLGWWFEGPWRWSPRRPSSSSRTLNPGEALC